MFKRLTKRARVRSAIVVACLYAMGVLAPSIAIASADRHSADHCFSEIQAAVGATHIHADGAVHEQHGDHGATGGKNETTPENCCGLFSVTAALAAPFAALDPPDRADTMHFALDNALNDRDTDRIDRPPRSPLSL
jgi:hypothetical protein